MKHVLTVAALLAACAMALDAQSSGPSYSSSTDGIDLAAPVPFALASADPQAKPVPQTAYKNKARTYPFKPLSRVALGAGFSVLGGVDFLAATNIKPWLNLRATGRYFSYTYNDGITESNIQITPGINLQSAQIDADLLPFPRHSNFHISPGIMFGASNNLKGNVLVPVNETITFNDVDYKAQGTLTGDFKINMSPRTTAATIGIGFGNLLPRKGSHWSIPVDLGIAFVGSPKAVFDLSGTVCTTTTPIVCQDVSTFQQFKDNKAAEEKSINDDMSILQFNPMFSVGLAFNFKIR